MLRSGPLYSPGALGSAEMLMRVRFPSDDASYPLRCRLMPQRADGNRALRVLQVMPPGKHFGPLRATSIDLDTRDFVQFSGHRQTTQVVADAVKTPFNDIDLAPFAAGVPPARHVAEVAARANADVIVVQQRLPLAAQIADLLPAVPIVLHTHNFQKHFADRPAIERVIRAPYRHRLYRTLAGIIHVSEACARGFSKDWPDVKLPSCVIGNGLDFSEWVPQAQREQEILCVARLAPEKGVLEAAEGIARVLPRFPDWRARFILSEVDRVPRYRAQVRAALSGLGEQVTVETDRPFAEVKRAYERAAVAIVPSKWLEPFGRTALEAHAGGAALISSGSGGLSEISGDAALMLPEVSPQAIELALERLLTDRGQRTQVARAGASRVRELFDIRVQAAAMDQFLERIAFENTGRGHV